MTGTTDRLPRKIYEKELLRLQLELVKPRAEGARVVVISEGCDERAVSVRWSPSGRRARDGFCRPA